MGTYLHTPVAAKLRRQSSNWEVVGSNPARDILVLDIFHNLGRKNREIQTCSNRVSRINFEGKSYTDSILNVQLKF